MTNKDKTATVHSIWIVRDNENFPRLVTCYIIWIQRKIMKLLDVVALLDDLSNLNLYRGQVGTIVEEYEPGVFEVEFSDTTGQAYAIETLNTQQLLALHHQPLKNSEPVLA